MPTILIRYVLREILWPTIVAGVGLTFIILSTRKVPGHTDERLLLFLIRLFFREDIAKGEVLQVLFFVLPTLILFIMPMALLIGITIGVGRMTLDLEVRAMQTSGINLTWVFLPVVGLAGALSLFAAFLSYAPEPRMIRSSMNQAGKLLISEFSNLEAGRVYEDLFQGRGGLSLYFEGRDDATSTMKGVALVLDRKAVETEQEKEARKAARQEKLKEVQRQFKAGKIGREEFERAEHEVRLAEKSERPVMIFAREAQFATDAEAGVVNLKLSAGSIHLSDAGGEGGVPRAAAAAASESLEGSGSAEPAAEGAVAEAPPEEPAEKILERASALPPDLGAEVAMPSASAAAGEAAKSDYSIIRFGQFSKAEQILSADAGFSRRSLTIPELWGVYRNGDQKEKDRFRAKATILERYSLSLESLVLALLGLPLAVWVRPTGKSIGVVLAFGLILVYHWLVRTGYSMVESDRAIGDVMIFVPNLLFAAVGGILWWRMIRR